MKASLATNFQSLVFRTYNVHNGINGMNMVPKSLFHRLYPTSLQAILTSKQLLSQNGPLPVLSASNYCACVRMESAVVQRLSSRSYSTQSEPSRKPIQKSDSSTRSRSKALTESSGDSGAVTLSLGEKVKENAKTGGYGVVILVGVAVTGAMLWFILSELFSSDSPNNIYTHAFKLCKLSPEVQDAVGTPIKCHGEETRRGWRRHVSHVEFFQGNTKYLRMKFYIEGPFNKGTVHLEKKKEGQGKYQYSYLMVDVEGYPPRRIDVHF